jgi:hypothetical protein
MSGIEVVTFEPKHPSADYLRFYKPLDEINSEIGLLNFDPSSDEKEPTHCTLVKGSWGEEDHPYNALSYVWGDPKDTETIIVNGHPFEATPNLVMFSSNSASCIKTTLFFMPCRYGWKPLVSINPTSRNRSKT